MITVIHHSIPWGTGNRTGERDLAPYGACVRASLYGVCCLALGPGSPVARAPRCGRGNGGSIPARGKDAVKGFVDVTAETVTPVMQNMKSICCNDYCKACYIMSLSSPCCHMTHYLIMTVLKSVLSFGYLCKSSFILTTIRTSLIKLV